MFPLKKFKTEKFGFRCLNFLPKINIEFSNAFNGKLSIFDVTGKLIDSIDILNLNSKQIDLSNLITGIYLIEISSTNQLVERIKIVKQ